MRLLKIAVWHPLSKLWRGDGGHRTLQYLGLLFAVFVTHALLRNCWLFRTDAFGFPIVGRVDKYMVHFLSIDYQWIFGYSLPIALVGVWFAKLHRPAYALLAIAHALLLLLTVADLETMRFLGMHLDLSLLSTYGNAASLREVASFIAHDRSVPYLPYVLFFGCLPFTALIVTVWRRLHQGTAPKWLAPSLIVFFMGMGLLAWSHIHVISSGTFRLLKLRPFVETAYLGLTRDESQKPAEDQVQAWARDYQSAWLARQGDSAWSFTDSAYPYLRTPRACRATGVEIPGDGIDQDCDGVDAEPVNVMVLFFESHRAVHCGHLRPYGALTAATPTLDSLAAQGRFFTRFSVGGIPTINALLATHLSVIQHPTRFIATDFAHIASLGFPQVLRRHGYATHFFSAPDPAWDNETPWLRQWYDGIHYDKSRELDARMFEHMSHYLRDSLDHRKPFFAACITRNNHYPFRWVEGVDTLPPDAGFTDKMSATMRYADRCLRDFMHSIQDEPWFKHTVFFILGDHGFPLGEHGSSNIGYGLYRESTWIPLVIYGEHPKLMTQGAVQRPASQIDLGPTVLDLAGITETNPFMGHSLLRPTPGPEFTWMMRGEQGLYETEAYRVHLPLGETPREQGVELFAAADSMERHPLRPDSMTLSPDAQAALQQAQKSLGLHAKLHQALLEGDRLWPRSRQP